MHVPVVPSNLIIYSALRHRDAPAGGERELYRATKRIYDEEKSTPDRSVVCKGKKWKGKETEPEANDGRTK